MAQQHMSLSDSRRNGPYNEGSKNPEQVAVRGVDQGSACDRRVHSLSCHRVEEFLHGRNENTHHRVSRLLKRKTDEEEPMHSVRRNSVRESSGSSHPKTSLLTRRRTFGVRSDVRLRAVATELSILVPPEEGASPRFVKPQEERLPKPYWLVRATRASGTKVNLW